MSAYDRFRREHQWLLRWAHFQLLLELCWLRVREFLGCPYKAEDES